MDLKSIKFSPMPKVRCVRKSFFYEMEDGNFFYIFFYIIYFPFFQVCDLQSKVKHYTKDNESLTTSMHAYRETQDELTTELADFKEKYREIADLLHDTQEELKKSRKRTYPGVGSHSIAGMFTSPATSAAARLEAEGNEEKGRKNETRHWNTSSNLPERYWLLCS